MLNPYVIGLHLFPLRVILFYLSLNPVHALLLLRLIMSADSGACSEVQGIIQCRGAVPRGGKSDFFT